MAITLSHGGPIYRSQHLRSRCWSAPFKGWCAWNAIPMAQGGTWRTGH